MDDVFDTHRINFTVILCQAIGLGYGKPSERLMEQPPRDSAAPLLSRRLLAWLAAVGLVMGAVTLGILSWAWSAHGETIARTMGLSTFLVATLLLSFESRDERRSAFSLDVFDDRTFIVATGISVAVIYLSTTLSPFQRFLDIAPLDLNQWLLCLAGAASVVVVAEIRKVLRRASHADAMAGPPQR